MKISFIIPAYNVEAYIDRCLESIVRQPFQDFEIIVVDDGSTDRTHAALEDWCRRDHRIQLHTQANAGQGAARSAGLEFARGDFIWFVDSDDWLIPSVLPRVAGLLDMYDPDVLVVNFEWSFDDRPAVPSNLVPDHLVGRLLAPLSSVDNFAPISCWNTPPWRLISRRSHLMQHGIRFPTGVFYEDHPFAIHLMLTAGKVYVDNGVVYSYYQRSSSTTKTNDRKAFHFLEIRRLCLGLFERFEQLDGLARLVVTYIAPLDFYRAHVAAEFRLEFLKRLAEELNPRDIAFIQRHGDAQTRLFLDAARAGDPEMIDRWEESARLRDRINRLGPRALAKRLWQAGMRRLRRLVERLRHLSAPRQAGVAVDHTGQRFLRAGTGTRVEPIRIEVRVREESRAYVVVGDHSHIGGTFVFERGIGQIKIGNRSSIGGGTTLICTQEAGITIGNSVMVSWGCTLMDSNAHSLDPDIRANDAYDWKCGVDAGRLGAFKDWTFVRSGPIVIEDGAWLGFESVVLKGVRIGRGAVVGARSVVTSDIPPYCIFAGNPARFVRLVPRERWTWDDIVEAAQGDPELRPMLRDAYLQYDVADSLQRFRHSGEFSETLAELRRYHPHARTLVDVGGGAGVMGMAFALTGYEVTLIEPSSSPVAGVAAAQRLLDIVEKTLDAGIRGRFHIRQGWIEDVPSGDRFDIAYCRQAVHHFSQPAEGLRKIREMLAPRAIIFLSREHVIFDELDREGFFASHPFQRYTRGEAAYRAEEYVAFLESAGFSVKRSYRFAETLINCYPHDPDYARGIDEREIAGRPYSFVAEVLGDGT